MNNFYARSVFFVNDAERSLRFYVDQLGFSEDWNYREEGRTFVCQVSRFGYELILNETHERTRARAGHGRVFIGLDDDQGKPLRDHIAAKCIHAERLDWGRPTLVIRTWTTTSYSSGSRTMTSQASRSGRWSRVE